MTRETKIGLLVGLGVILFFAILVSEFISVANNQDSAQLDQLAEAPTQNPPRTTPAVTRVDPLPQPGRPAAQPAQPNEPPAETNPMLNLEIPRFQGNLHSLSQTDSHEPPAPRQSEIPVNTFEPDRLVIGAREDVTRHDNTTTETGDRWHTVRSGENLSSISLKYYGDRNYYHSIFEANRDRMSSVDDVMVGVRLLIPMRDGSGPATEDRPAAAPQPRRTPTTTGYVEYEVQPGDTLGEIAQKQLGSVRYTQEIIDLNRNVIRNPDNVPAGVVLKLPRR